MKEYADFWEISSDNIDDFLEFAEGSGLTISSFTPMNGYFYLEQTPQNEANYGFWFTDWDLDDDGEANASNVATHRWVISQVPSVLWP